MTQDLQQANNKQFVIRTNYIYLHVHLL